MLKYFVFLFAIVWMTKSMIILYFPSRTWINTSKLLFCFQNMLRWTCLHSCFSLFWMLRWIGLINIMVSLKYLDEQVWVIFFVLLMIAWMIGKPKNKFSFAIMLMTTKMTILVFFHLFRWACLGEEFFVYITFLMNMPLLSCFLYIYVVI